MMSYAGQRLGGFGQQCLGIAHHDPLQRPCLIELSLHELTFHSVSMSRALNDGLVQRGFSTHEQRDANDTLVANYGCFGQRTIVQLVEQRDDGGGGEIDMSDRGEVLALGFFYIKDEKINFRLVVQPEAVLKTKSSMVPKIFF